MTAELWAIPALLLVLLLIGLVALMRGRSRSQGLPTSRQGALDRPLRPTSTQPPTRPPTRHPSRPFEHSAGDEFETQPDNLLSRREATTEALKLARQRVAADMARQSALRQSRAQAAGQAPGPSVVTPLRRPQPPARPALPPLREPAPGAAPIAARPAVRDRPASTPLPVPVPMSPPVTPPPGMAAPTLASRVEPAPLARAPAPPAPLARSPLQPVQSPMPWPAPAAPVAAAPLLPVAPITVLVVDDSKVVRIKTGRLLEKHHYKVVLADDGLTALQALAEQWPDLVITDVEMPGLDGFGLTQQLRNQPQGQAMPVIMITSSNDRHREAAARAGVSVLLGKPYPEQQLLAEVEKALGRVAQPAPAGLLMQ